MRKIFRASLFLFLGLVLILGWVWFKPDKSELPMEFKKLESIAAELFFLDAHAITKRGSSNVVVLRVHNRVDVVPYHFRSTSLTRPAPIEAWGDLIDAPILFNAGQFDDKLNHLGWLKSKNRWLNKHRKKQWMGLLVSQPLQGESWAGIVDLSQSNSDIVHGYQNVLQSMMLVDEHAQVRVRHSDLSACRTVVAQDKQGRLLVLLTQGAVVLAELAQWLPTTHLNIVRAMNLDGGIESQLFIQTPEIEIALYGQHGTGTKVFDASPGKFRFPIPTVVALYPHL